MREGVRRIWVAEVDLLDCIGVDATALLLRRMGGLRFYLPRTPARPDNELSTALGPMAYAALCARWGGNVIALPAPGDRPTARKAAFRLFAEGELSHMDIARELRVGVRYIEMLSAEYKAAQKAPKQHSLLSLIARTG